jgi:hypothetical protein
MDKTQYKIKDKLQASTEGNNTLIQKVNKQTKMRSGNKNMITRNYITQNFRSMNKYY